jgi:hypothetical protein
MNTEQTGFGGGGAGAASLGTGLVQWHDCLYIVLYLM